MESPFVFGNLAVGGSFVNRKKDMDRLASNYHNRVNTILMSPRRWGKSSLVRQTAISNSGKKEYCFCFIDLFMVRSESEFYSEFARQVIKSSSDKLDGWMSMAKKFLH